MTGLVTEPQEELRFGDAQFPLTVLYQEDLNSTTFGIRGFGGANPSHPISLLSGSRRYSLTALRSLERPTGSVDGSGWARVNRRQTAVSASFSVVLPPGSPSLLS